MLCGFLIKLRHLAGTWVLAGIVIANPSLAVADTLVERLERPLTAHWHGQELAVVLERIAASQNVTIWLDRRVDPQIRVEARFSGIPLRQVLDQLTAGETIGWSQVGKIIYLGPRQSAREVATLAERAKESLARTSASNRKRWLLTEPMTWPRLSEPREILGNWLTTADIELSNGEAIPHDLWNAKKLPPTPLVDRVVLLLAGFDLTCDLSNNKCRVVPVSRPVEITRRYDVGNRLADLRNAFKQDPTVRILQSGKQATITARSEDHDRAKDILNGSASAKRPSRQPTKQNSQQVFSLKLENQPVGNVIDQLASQLGLEVVWSVRLRNRTPDPRTSLVSCDVQNGDLSALLAAVLGPAGLKFELEGQKLEIIPIE